MHLASAGAGLDAGDDEKSSKREPEVRGAGRGKRRPRGAPADARPRSCPDSREARQRSVALNKQLMKAGSLQVPCSLTSCLLARRSASLSKTL